MESSSRSRPTTIALATLVAPVSWGTTYITITELLPDGRPLFVALMRVLPAGLLLAGFGYLRHSWRPHGREWARLAVLALFNFGVFFPLLIVAVYRLPGGVAASVGGTQPLLVGLVAWLSTRQRMRRVDTLVGAISAAGVALVVLRPGAGIDTVGVLAAVGANASFAVGVVATKRLPPPEHGLAATGWQMLIGAAVVAPISFVVEGAAPPVTTINLVGFAYLGLIATGGAFVLWFRGISRLPVQAPPVLGLAAPLTGAALGWIVLGEDLSPLQLVGFTVTVAAITYAATVGSRIAESQGATAPDRRVARA